MNEITVSKISILPISKSTFMISWEFAPMIRKYSEFEFYLEQSAAPHDGFIRLAKINPQDKYYLDRDVRVFQLWKSYYVRMRIKDKESGQVYYSQTAAVEHPPSLEAMELIRRTKITLENPRFGNGVPCTIFIRKNGGQRCFECFDPIKKRSTKSTCLSCFGTTYDGGFYSPIDEVYINFSVDHKVTSVSDLGQQVLTGNRAMLANYPLVKSGDVIADRRLNRMWTIQDVQHIERRRHVIKQILSLREEERTSVLFELLAQKNGSDNA